MNYRHGYAKTKTYRAWAQLIQRCSNDKLKCWGDYGGRGIDYDPRWNDFTVFLSDMGECPSNRSLDRINNDRGYWPDNARWATRLEQNRNRRGVTIVEHNGKRMTLPEWSLETGIKVATLRQRLHANWSTQEMFSLSPKIGRNQHNK